MILIISLLESCFSDDNITNFTFYRLIPLLLVFDSPSPCSKPPPIDSISVVNYLVLLKWFVRGRQGIYGVTTTAQVAATEEKLARKIYCQMNLGGKLINSYGQHGNKVAEKSSPERTPINYRTFFPPGILSHCQTLVSD